MLSSDQMGVDKGGGGAKQRRKVGAGELGRDGKGGGSEVRWYKARRLTGETMNASEH